MPIFVKDAGQWREISSSTGGEVFLRDGTSYTNKTINNIYVNDSGTWKEVYSLFETTSFATVSTAGSSQVSVPSNANAIHVQQAVGGGSGGVTGAEYDKAGGESAGAAGASGAYVSDRVYTVSGGEQLTINVGNKGGQGGGNAYSTTAGSGGTTSLSGATTGSIFSLGGGGGGSASGGGVQGPLRNNSPSTPGTATQGTSLSSGTTVDGLNITTFNGGEANSFNAYGNGVAGTNPGNCGGDNCQITGGVGGSSYNGAIAGGAGGVASSSVGGQGSRGSGGGGGGAQGQTAGGDGGVGEMVYRFLRIA